MNRVVWCVLLGAMGCFDPSHPAADDPASDATPEHSGVTSDTIVGEWGPVGGVP